MSVYGISIFENDTALEWIEDFLEEIELEAALETLKAAEESDYKIIECEEAIVAAEVLAALNGNGREDFPDELYEMIKENEFYCEEEELELATEVVENIKRSSELKEIWQESVEYNSWLDEMNDLIERLK